MSITLEVRDPATGVWHDLSTPPVHLGERARVRVAVRTAAADARLYVGDVLVASSQWEDRAEYFLNSVAYPFVGWSVVGKLLRDWVGETELRGEILEAGVWTPLATLGPVYVEPERLRPDEFAALCDAVAAESADLLYDVYGKTGFGSARGGRSSVAPAAIVARVRHALDQLSTALTEIARQPAYRLKTRRLREPALPGQAVTDLTLEEACFDPSMAVAVAGRVRFREQVREVAVLNYKLEENHLIADFLAFLGQQLFDLRAALRGEIAWREAQRPARDRPGADGQPSWWANEDRPRIDECARMIRHADLAETEVNRLASYSFLPIGAPLNALPSVTALVRTNRAYAGAYRVIADHFAGHRLRIDAAHLVTRARSLPVLYEWWCALEVIRILRTLLHSTGAKGLGRRLETEQGKYVVEFAANQSIDFVDDAGRRVRFRYQPAYSSTGEGRQYGHLGRGSTRTPDMAIEVFSEDTVVPELIVILDAKYTSAPHMVKLDAVKLKYDRIGSFRTGRVLGRQIWALVPSRPKQPASRTPDWATLCTVDNIGVFADDFDSSSCSVGVIHAVPLTGPGKSAVELLLRHLLTRCGLQLRQPTRA